MSGGGRRLASVGLRSGGGTSDVANAMKTIGLPLLIALVPLIALSALQFSLPVVAPLLMQSMGLPAEAFGAVAGVAGLGSVWFYVTNHATTPAFGPVRTLQFGMVLAAAGAALIVFGAGPLVYLGALMMGFGYGTTTPAGSQVLADFTPKQRWGTLFSVRQAGVPIGGVVAGLGTTTASLAYGWQSTVLALAVLVFVCRVGAGPRAQALQYEPAVHCVSTGRAVLAW